MVPKNLASSVCSVMRSLGTDMVPANFGLNVCSVMHSQGYIGTIIKPENALRVVVSSCDVTNPTPVNPEKPDLCVGADLCSPPQGTNIVPVNSGSSVCCMMHSV